MSPAEQLDFFVSYPGADRPWAEWISWVLDEAGYFGRIQAWDFAPGANFVLEMDEATRISPAHDRCALAGVPRVRVRPA